MPRNVEIKARLRDREGVEALVGERAHHGPERIEQADVFFRCDDGRLKLRTFADGTGEMIFYRRLDTEGPTQSEFLKAPASDPEAMTRLLGSALGVIGVVCKRRTLYLIGQTRVHLDEVEGLGHYIELEVVLENGQSTDEGSVIARELMARLDITERDLEARAYIDLLARTTSGAPPEGG
jgi:predicted adenylyl cyclase CyaB